MATSAFATCSTGCLAAHAASSAAAGNAMNRPVRDAIVVRIVLLLLCHSSNAQSSASEARCEEEQATCLRRKIAGFTADPGSTHGPLARASVAMVEKFLQHCRRSSARFPEGFTRSDGEMGRGLPFQSIELEPLDQRRI